MRPNIGVTFSIRELSFTSSQILKTWSKLCHTFTNILSNRKRFSSIQWNSPINRIWWTHQNLLRRFNPCRLRWRLNYMLHIWMRQGTRSSVCMRLIVSFKIVSNSYYKLTVQLSQLTKKYVCACDVVQLKVIQEASRAAIFWIRKKKPFPSKGKHRSA